MKFTELKSKSDAEIKNLLGELRGQAHDLSVKLRLSQQKNVKELAGVRKDIARILTYLHTKKS